MLTLSYLGEAKEFDLTSGINLFAVRNPPRDEYGKVQIPQHFIHIPELSPSTKLREDTRRWDKEFGAKENWWHLYVPRFKRELEERPDLVRAMHVLEWLLQQGFDVRLFCFCKEVDGCHRGLVGEKIMNRGYEVDFRRTSVFQARNPFEQLTLF